MSTSENRIEALLLHDGFVRALARSLLADRASADDVAQEAWVAALERGHEADSIPRWLAGVVKNLSVKRRRCEERRARRERASARPEATPSAEEILEREAARARVVEAVLALEEPYREAVLLRYFENLPPRAIAKRRGLPVETVRTRVKRALEMLRARLDREYGGGRGAWSLALVPFARLAGASLAPVSLLAMTLQSKLAVGVATAAVAALFLLPERRSDPSRPAEAHVVPAPALLEEPRTAAAPELPAPEVVPARTALPVEEKQQEPITPEPLGTLLVRVTWWDKTPAGDVHARAESVSEVRNQSWRALEFVTDSAGEFRVERLPPGHASVVLDRGGYWWVEIESGKEALLEVELERGFDVAGVVLDPAGRTVSGADVWLSYVHTWEQGTVVARTGADGGFLLRSCGGGVIGARAARFAPSLLQSLDAAEGAELTLELVLMGPGGELAGTVFDPEGRVVPSAFVLVGKYWPGMVTAVPVGGVRPLTGRTPGQQEGRTDAAGRYEVRGLAPGVQPVVVCAAGFGLWRGEAEVFDRGSSNLDVRLVPGVTLEGRVVDPDGQPLEAQIRIGRPGPLCSETTTDHEGRFRLEDLEPGEFEVFAEQSTRTSTKLRGAPGETLHWEAVLAQGGAIRGRLVDEQGAGVAGWYILAEDEPPSAADMCAQVNTCRTDAEGRFALEGLGNHRHHVEAHPEGMVLFPAAVAAGVFPEGEEVLLRIDPELRPSVRIAGTVVDERGRAVANAQLRVRNAAFNRESNEAPGPDGNFELGPYPPGDWRLRLSSPELPECPELALGPHALAAGETWDCGTIVLQSGGTLLVRAANPEHAVLELLVRQGTSWRGKLHAEGAAWRSDPLAPGSYRLALRGAGVAAALVPFEIRSGAATELELPLAAGLPVTIRVLADNGGTRRQPVLRITDATGAALVEEDLWLRKTGDYGLDLALAPGRYRAEAWLSGGGRADAELVVGEEGAGPPLVLELR